MSSSNSQVVAWRQAARHEETSANGLARGTLLAIDADGTLRVRASNGQEVFCDWLEQESHKAGVLTEGDLVLLLQPVANERGVVLGRIGRYRAPVPEAHVTIEATETLTLKCGASSVDLRADGKLMVRGEDVLLRARGTQRIRAGTVAIN